MAAPPRLLALGASDETGYEVGARDGSPRCDDDLAVQQDQDQGKAWPQLTACAMGADLHNFSGSGQGVARNWIPPDNAKNLPLCLSLADPTVDPSQWNAGSLVPDAVVVDLGRNGMVGLLESPPTPAPPMADFVDAYVGMLAAIAAPAPQARMDVVLPPGRQPTAPNPRKRPAGGRGCCQAARPGRSSLIESPAYNGA